MNNFERPNDDLELKLSQEELAGLRNEIAEWVITHDGEIVACDGVDAATPGQRVYEFRCQLDDKDFIGHTFFPEGGVLPKEAIVSCTTPYDIEPGAHDSKYSFGVDVIARGIVANDSLNSEDQLEVSVHIGIREFMHNDHFEGYHTTEYAVGDKRVSPNDVRIDDPSTMSIDDGMRLLEDLGALEHELTIDDGETLHQVIDHLKQR